MACLCARRTASGDRVGLESRGEPKPRPEGIPVRESEAISRAKRTIRAQRRPALMSEETFGPAGRPRRSDDFEVRREEFAEKLNLQLEPKAEPEFIPPEPPWDADRKSWWTGYLKRNPQARPKPREIKKLGQVAPGVDGSEYLAKLLNEIKTLLANYAIFEERLAAFEAKVSSDPCEAEHGPGWRQIDSECVKLDVSSDGENP